MWPMSDEIRRNNLLAYERLTRTSGPAMTWSMHSIGFLDLNDFAKADDNFRRSYASYVRAPFNVWTETQSGIGAVNFLTGIGGFLQAVVFGYGGIRLKIDQLEFKPTGHLPEQATKFIYHGIKYQGDVLDLTVNNNNTYEIFVREQNPNSTVPLAYQHGETSGVLKVNDRLSFPVNTLLIIRPSVSLFL
jgi:trehalose/maltose hydrolase-like predicted phosphorylase